MFGSDYVLGTVCVPWHAWKNRLQPCSCVVHSLSKDVFEVDLHAEGKGRHGGCAEYSGELENGATCALESGMLPRLALRYCLSFFLLSRSFVTARLDQPCPDSLLHHRATERRDLKCCLVQSLFGCLYPSFHAHHLGPFAHLQWWELCPKCHTHLL